MSDEFKKGRHKYAVDVTFYCCHCVEVEAESRDEAQRIVESKIRNGEIQPTSRGFEFTDDFEAEVSGEELLNGEIQYY